MLLLQHFDVMDVHSAIFQIITPIRDMVDRAKLYLSINAEN